MNQIFKSKFLWINAVLILLLMTVAQQRATAQDQDQDDPPGRVARLGYIEGSVSFEPAGEQDWVEATPNRPMTTGDQLWVDRDSRAEVQLGSASIRLSANTGISFLNLDDRTVQIQLTSGALNIRVRRLNRDEVFEIDTPNQAFSVYQPGSYRVNASEDGTYTVVSVRQGEGESTGNGETFTLHAGQQGTFSGTDTLNADVVDLGSPDDFDNWASGRDRRWEGSRSARYLAPDVVGYEDLDDNGDWRDDSNYGHVWFPNRVDAGWAPYHEGHWAWISPWGWTWVDDAPWGYAPFHYGRWVTISGRWGWVAGPVDVAPVYAPALVVFLGGGLGVGVNVGWFPLGPREVFVPTYSVSRGYMTRVNVSNTTVNTTTITNVYNTTVINKSTTITNITYANRTVPGAVTAVPQNTFSSAQPVARAAIRVDQRQLASATVAARVAIAPSQQSVLGFHANTANHVSAPPAAVARRQVVAKATPPAPPVSFARQQQALAAHPGQPLARKEMQTLRPAAAQPHPMVKVAPPGKPATPNMVRPGNQPNQPGAGKPNTPAANAPGNRPGNQPSPGAQPGAGSTTPNRPQPNQPAPGKPATNNRPEPTQPNNRPEQNRPEPTRPTAPPPARNDHPPSAQPNNRPEPNRPELNQPANRPEQNRPEPTRPTAPPAQNDRPPSAQPNNRPEPNQPANRPEQNRPAPTRPTPPPERNDRPPVAQPNNHPAPTPPAPRPQTPPAAERPQPQRTPPPSERPQPQRPAPPAETRPAPKPEKPEPKKQQTPEEKKKEEQKKPPAA